jgi:hypothetical protein
MKRFHRRVADLAMLALFGAALHCSAPMSNDSDKPTTAPAEPTAPVGVHGSAEQACGFNCDCLSDGSISCECSAANYRTNPGLCCPNGKQPSGICYVNCASCQDPTDPTCCDPQLRGYICQCAGPLSSATGPLDYYLLAVTYEPPGNLSTATYLNGTSIGTQVQIQITSAAGVTAQVQGPTFQVSGSYQYGNISGEAFQVTSNGSWGPQVTSNTDLIDHLNDKFWLWTNPDMTATTQDNNYSVQLKPPSDQLINVIDLSLAELAGLVPIPAFKAAQIQNLTDVDKAAILRSNPFVTSTSGDINPTPTLDPNRFTFLKEHFQVTGPDHPGDPPAGIALDTNVQNIHGLIEGYQHQTQLSFQYGASVSFITSASAFAGVTFQYTYQKVTQSNTGTITDAQGLLESNTVCWHQGIDVYWDGAFGTYLFLPTDQGSSDCNEKPGSTGLVFNGSGQPMANAQVTGTLPDGTLWITTTNAQGLFKFYRLPSGTTSFPINGPAGSTVTILTGPGAPPTTTASLTPPPNSYGWENTAVTVSLSAVDNTGFSGVKQITYSATGAAVIPSTVAAGSAASFVIGAEGTTVVNYFATDNANDVEKSKSLTLNLDLTPPTVSFAGNAGTYQVTDTVNIVCSAADSLSGVLSTTCQNISGPAYSFNAGLNTFTASATDRAGNVGTGTTSFILQVTPSGLCSLTDQFVTEAGVANSLCAKLSVGAIGAYRLEVAAQSDKSMTAGQAAILTRLSNAL